MAGYPYMQFYTGDWLKDPALTVCSPATRGVWIDLLSAMHESGRSGELRGTNEQLARLARCPTSDLVLALTELQTTGAADVTERNKIVTVTNRRMLREHKIREGNQKRQERFREKQRKRPCNGVDPESDPDPEKAERVTARARPTLVAVKTKCQMAGWPEAEGEAFWHHFEASGWIDKNGHSVQVWESKLATWVTNARAKSAHHGSQPNGRTNTPPIGVQMIVWQKELDRTEDRLRSIRGSYDGHQSWSEKDKVDFRALKARRDELKGQLGMKV